MNYSQAFLAAVEEALQAHAKSIKNRVISEYKDFPWRPEHYQQLQALIRQDLDILITDIFGIFDNVGGGRTPEGVLGYTLKAVIEEGTTVEEHDLRMEEQDYADMWNDYLNVKKRISSK